MKVRFGFVAMALSLTNASPSQTMTYKVFQSIADKEAALLKATHIAEKNLENTLRILRHAKASGVDIYRFSSKLIPLYTHEATAGWNFLDRLRDPFLRIGEFVRDKQMRVSFHPDHFIVLNSPKPDVFDSSIIGLQYHVDMFEAMALDDRSKLVIHVGGGYKDKATSLKRFVDNWSQVPAQIQHRLTLENDDKTYTAKDTEYLSRTLGVPMVFDLHHHICNACPGDRPAADSTRPLPSKDDLIPVVEPFLTSWRNEVDPPMAHMSSPKDEKNFRAHADNVDVHQLLPLLECVREFDTDLDVMIEAKRKDEALFALMRDLAQFGFVRVITGGSIEYRP